MASGDSRWAQARALGFLASASVKGSIKRVLILMLGPASLRLTIKNWAIKARGRWTTATTDKCRQEKGQANKDDGLRWALSGVLREHQRETPRTQLNEGSASHLTTRHIPSSSSLGNLKKISSHREEQQLWLTETSPLSTQEELFLPLALWHSLTVPLSCTSTTGRWTTWGYKGSSLIHTFCKKTLKYLLLPLVLTETAWPCFASAYMSLF